MPKTVKRVIAMLWAVLFLLGSPMSYSVHVLASGFPIDIVKTVEPVSHEHANIPKPKSTSEPISTPDPTPSPTIKPETVIISPAPVPEPEVSYDISDDYIDLIAIVVMAEAEGEPEYGQRLVIDTILNRADHYAFPDDIYDVIYQKNQFTSMWNGRADRCYPKSEIVQLVKEELVNRTDSSVIFFRTKRYSTYGSPMFQVGHHYFSSYD